MGHLRQLNKLWINDMLPKTLLLPFPCDPLAQQLGSVQVNNPEHLKSAHSFSTMKSQDTHEPSEHLKSLKDLSLGPKSTRGREGQKQGHVLNKPLMKPINFQKKQPLSPLTIHVPYHILLSHPHLYLAKQDPYIVSSDPFSST
jgi:hypothetical protein